MKLRALVPVTMLAVGGALLLAAPADAATLTNETTSTSAGGAPSESCSSGVICLWNDVSYNSEEASFTPTSDGQCWNLTTAGFNDITSSVINDTGNIVYLYQNTNEGGDFVVVGPGEGIPNLASNQVVYNNNGTTAYTGSFTDEASSVCYQ